MPFPGPCSSRLLHTALGYTRKCTEWQIRITTRKSCSIFFFVRLFLHDIFFKFELLARYFFGDSTPPPPPSKIKWSVPYYCRLNINRTNSQLILLSFRKCCGTADRLQSCYSSFYNYFQPNTKLLHIIKLSTIRL